MLERLSSRICPLRWHFSLLASVLSLLGSRCVEGANQTPVVVLKVTQSGPTSPASVPVVLEATVSDADGSIVKVEFFAGDKLLQTVPVIPGFPIPFIIVWAPAAEGVYQITARATDNLGAVGTSAAVAVTIGAGTVKTPPTVSLLSPTNNAEIRANKPVVLEAEAKDADGTIVGVEFFESDELIARITTPPFTLVTNLELGEYVFHVRATDNDGSRDNSARVNVKIIPPAPNVPPTIQLAGVPAGPPVNAPASFTVRGTAQDSDGTVSSVEYFDGETPLGRVVSAPYEFTISHLGFGVHTISARATDNSGGIGASPPVTIQVALPGAGGTNAPRLSAALDGNRAIKLSVAGTVGAYYSVEASPDLSHWYGIDEFGMVATPQLIEIDQRPAAEFFRVVTVEPSELANPLRVFPDLGEAHLVTADTAAESGEYASPSLNLSLTNKAGVIFTLNIPTNALLGSAIIQMREVRAISGLPLAGGMLGAIEIFPADLPLLDPATLTMTLPASLGTNRLAAFAYGTGGAEFHFIPRQISGNAVVVQLFRLEGYGAGIVTGADLQGQEFRKPADPIRAIEQAVAISELKRSGLRALDAGCGVDAGVIQVTRSSFFKLLGDKFVERDCKDLRGLFLDAIAFKNQVHFTLKCDSEFRYELSLIDSVLEASRKDSYLKDCLKCPVPPEKLTPDGVRERLLLYQFASRFFNAADMAQHIYPVIRDCLSFDLEIGSTNTVVGAASVSTYKATMETPPARIHLGLSSSGLFFGQGPFNYDILKFKWPKPPDACQLSEDRLINGSIFAYLDFSDRSQDALSGEWKAEIQLVITFTSKPTEIATQKCYGPDGKLVLEESLPRDYWFTTFAVAHASDMYVAEGGRVPNKFLFDLFNFEGGSPWASRPSPASARKGKVTYKDETIINLYHTP